MPLYGGIEAGGTKFVCAVARRPGEIVDEQRFPTTQPEETIGAAIAFLEEHHRREPLHAVGISSFGPVDPDPASATFGYVTTTPKPGWSNTDFAGAVQRAFGVPVGFDTDVNGAALAEHRWGAARGLDTFVYMTIGTGIGGGGLVNGGLMHGLVHPEMGHMRLPHDRAADPYEGCCPFHGDCLEGLACGPALEARWGGPAKELPEEHEAWGLEAHYLALAAVNIVCTLSPQRIILGGGVMEQEHLFPRIRSAVTGLLNDYVKAPAILERMDSFIVPPELGGRAGVLGAVALAERAAAQS